MQSRPTQGLKPVSLLQHELLVDVSFGGWVLAVTNNLCRMTDMTELESGPPPAVGAYWINEGDYPALLRIFADGDAMPRIGKERLKIAEEMENGLKAYGHVVMRVRIDPSTFPDWCAVHGTNTGREGRKKLVAAAVVERYDNQT